MLKKFLIGTVVALALLVGVTASAAYDFGPTTLKVGSTGQYVMNLQTVVGATPIDGVFGPMTKAKVMAWQASNGLVADGLVGPATKNALNAGTFTGGTTLPAGCTVGALFSATTGIPCSVVTTLPAGCTAGALFSSTTGQSCTGTVTPGVDTGVLAGTIGDITVSDFTSGTEQVLRESASEKVLGVYVEAGNSSDVAVTAMKVTLAHSGADSTRIERYIDSVDVYMGSTKVGSVDADGLSKDSTGNYSKTIMLSNAIVKMGDKTKFYVALNANSVIDSNDVDNTWAVDVTSVRFQDAMGVMTTESYTSEVAAVTVSFEDSTTNDEIISYTSSLNPDTQTLTVSDTGTSEEYLAFAFKLKAAADSTDLNVLSIPITVTTNATSADPDRIISDIHLVVGSKTYDNSELSGAIYTFTIDEGDFEIAEGDTVEVKVYATFNEAGLSTTYLSGKTAVFSLDASNMTVENINGDSVSTASVTDRSGNTLTLSTDSVAVSAYSWSVNSTGTIADLFFTVKNDGNESYDVLSAEIVDTATGTASITNTGSTPVTSGSEYGVLSRFSGDEVDALSTTGFTLGAGEETVFRVRYSLTGATNGLWKEIKVTSVAGQTVTDTKQTSPTITISYN